MYLIRLQNLKKNSLSWNFEKKKKKLNSFFFLRGILLALLPDTTVKAYNLMYWCTQWHKSIFFTLQHCTNCFLCDPAIFVRPSSFSHNWITMHASMCRPLQNTWLSIKDKPLLIHSNRIFLRHLRSKCLARSAVSNKQAQIGHCFHTCSFRKQTTCWLYTSGTNITALNE